MKEKAFEIDATLESTQSQDPPHIRREPKAVQDRQQIKQCLVVRIVCPTLDRDPVRCGGVHRAVRVRTRWHGLSRRPTDRTGLTLVDPITGGRIVDQAHPTQILIHNLQILEVRPVLERACLRASKVSVMLTRRRRAVLRGIWS